MPDTNVTLEKIREAIENTGAKWIAGDTSISLLAPDIRAGLLSSSPFEPAVATKPLPKLLTSLPASFDWTNVDGKSYVTSVKNQNGGTCTAFAATAALESCLVRMGLGQIDMDLSEQAIISSPDGGTGNLHQIAAFLKTTGVPPENWFPGDLSTARAGWKFETYTVKHWDFLYPKTVNELKALIVQIGHVIAGMNCPEDFFSYKSGIYSSVGLPICKNCFHAFLVVGYDDNEKCFKCKNSWGESRGESGYFRIAYSEFHKTENNGTDFGNGAHIYLSAVRPHIASVKNAAMGADGNLQVICITDDGLPHLVWQDKRGRWYYYGLLPMH